MYFEKLSDYHCQKNHGTRTRSHYRAIIERFGNQAIAPESIAEYRDKRLSEGRTADTVRAEISKLCAFARWLGVDPELTLPRKVHRPPTEWSCQELHRLFAAARSTSRIIYGVPGSIYWPALLGVACDAGERIRTIVGIEWGDIDFVRRSVMYRAELCEGDAADNCCCTLSRRTVKDLLLLRASGVERPFRLGCESTRWKAYKTLLEDAGLPSDRRSKLHRLCRANMSLVHRAGVWLGWR